MFRHNPYRMPDRYRDSNPYSKDFFKLWFLMPATIVLCIMLMPFLEMQLDIRMIYSDIYIKNSVTTTDNQSIVMEYDYGLFSNKEGVTFNISSFKNGKIINIQQSKNNTDNKIITIPVNATDKQITIQQKNGLKQLILELDKETLEWKSASDWSKFIFFTQYHPVGCIVFCSSSLGLIVGLVLLIRLIAKRTRKSDGKDPFTDEL